MTQAIFKPCAENKLVCRDPAFYIHIWCQYHYRIYVRTFNSIMKWASWKYGSRQLIWCILYDDPITRHVYYIRADSWLASSQWETSLQSNAVSHWMGANLKSALYMINIYIIHIVDNVHTSMLCFVVFLWFCKQFNSHWFHIIRFHIFFSFVSLTMRNRIILSIIYHVGWYWSYTYTISLLTTARYIFLSMRYLQQLTRDTVKLIMANYFHVKIVSNFED